MHFKEHLNIKPCKFHTFENYFHENADLKNLEQEICANSCVKRTFIIAGENGNGISHLLSAIANKHLENNSNVFSTKSNWLLHFLKLKVDSNEIIEFILSFNVICIDDIQLFNRKTNFIESFLKPLVNKASELNKLIYFGCTNLNPIKNNANTNLLLLLLNHIELKSPSSANAFKMLKYQCEFEKSIPDRLLYIISSYNGTFRHYLNCLISVRFKDTNIDFNKMTDIEIENKFNLKAYFPKQQLRRGFAQFEIGFEEKIGIF